MPPFLFSDRLPVLRTKTRPHLKCHQQYQILFSLLNIDCQLILEDMFHLELFSSFRFVMIKTYIATFLKKRNLSFFSLNWILVVWGSFTSKGNQPNPKENGSLLSILYSFQHHIPFSNMVACGILEWKKFLMISYIISCLYKWENQGLKQLYDLSKSSSSCKYQPIISCPDIWLTHL